MKKMMLLLVIAGITTATCMAQNKSQGSINYEVTFNIHASMKPDQLQFKDMVPEKVVNKEVLYFNGSKTYLSRKDPDEIASEEGATVKINTNNGPVAVYTDESTGQSWALIEKDGKKTLLLKEKGVGKEKRGDKPGIRTKTILGFTCRELQVKNGEDGLMTLWITDSFPFTAGPLGIAADKGLVLGVDSRKMSAVATAIDYSSVSISKVSIPAGIPVRSAKE